MILRKIWFVGQHWQTRRHLRIGSLTCDGSLSFVLRCCPHSIACSGHLNTTATFIFDFIPFDFQQNLQPIVIVVIIIIIVVVTHALVRVQLPENVSCCCARSLRMCGTRSFAAVITS